MTAPSHNRRWVWFFAVLVILAGAGVTIPIVFNLRQQLTRADLDAAIQRWKEHGPRSYNLRYVVKKGADEKDVYLAEIRNGRVVVAYHNGRRLDAEKSYWHDMEHRFSDIQGFMDEDAKPGKPAVFVKAQFDAKDGRLIHYVRSVKGTRQRVEIDVQELTPVASEVPG